MTEEQKQRYYGSQRWFVKRDAVVKRSEGVCERCCGAKVARVCHKTFIRMGNERLEDLEGLCMGCFELNYVLKGKRSEEEPQEGQEPEWEDIGDDEDQAEPSGEGSSFKPKIYCAGKISKNSGPRVIDYKPIERKIGEKSFLYVGPFFVSCDHGCFHGKESHGQGVMMGSGEHGTPMMLRDDEFVDMLRNDPSEQGLDPLAPCGTWVKRNEVVRLCTSQIESCDILWARIGEESVYALDGSKVVFATCYGTMFEIGYARSMGKYVHVTFSSNLICRQAWFHAVASNSWNVGTIDGYEGMLDAINKHEALMSKIRSINARPAHTP